jgi:hypothetical protein
MSNPMNDLSRLGSGTSNNTRVTGCGVAPGHDLKPSIGQCLDNAFRDLFSFLWIDPGIWVIFARTANCRRND